MEGGSGWSRPPGVVNGCGEGSPSPCERTFGVWCSYEKKKRAMCQVACLLATTELICYPLYKLCIYKYNTLITFPYKTKSNAWSGELLSILKSGLQC